MLKKERYSSKLVINTDKGVNMYSVELAKLINEFALENLTPEIDFSKILIEEADVNRPALQLTGFFDYFPKHRIQIMGLVEHTYFNKMHETFREEVIEKLFSMEIPCLILSRGLDVPIEILMSAKRYQVPILRTNDSTTDFIARLIAFLQLELAPRQTIHGVLVDVYGEGVLIIGESGIGKSETALELIKRGHRLVADDAVEIKRVSAKTLVGSCPAVIRHFIELRGIGIVDVKNLFGVESVKDTQGIDLVIKLETWDQKREYDRLGMVDNYMEILGNQVVCHEIPIRPGRNIAIIAEAAAINHRQKKMGYNAAHALNERLMASIESNK